MVAVDNIDDSSMLIFWDTVILTLEDPAEMILDMK
jgi:hypothetical protein